jgi:GxxExxY protein
MDDELTHRIIGAALEVHRIVGPGVLESTYEECLAVELAIAGLDFGRQLVMPLNYKSVEILHAYRCDLLVEREVIVEVKAVDKVLPVHTAQVRTYLTLSGLDRGLLFNFKSILLKDGIYRISRSVSWAGLGNVGEN